MNMSVITITEKEVWEALQKVQDPEIPVLSVVDMGMITGVKVDGERQVINITFTPTFVGCPAIEMIRNSMRKEVEKLPAHEVIITTDFETRWSSDRMSPEAKQKLEKFGIAPPAELKDEELTLEMLNRVRCPHCGSTDTTLRSSFGSTLCRAIRFCFTCKQGFEQFKPVQ